MMKEKCLIICAVIFCAMNAPSIALPVYTSQYEPEQTFDFYSVTTSVKVGEVKSSVYLYDDTSIADADYYIYTYRLTNLTADFSWFSVGLLSGATVDQTGVDSTGVDPWNSEWKILPSSVEAAFFTDPVGLGETSSLLWFTSPDAPNPNNGIGAMSGYSAAGFAFAQGHLFTPVPEPLTVTLLGFGWLAVRSFRRK